MHYAGDLALRPAYQAADPSKLYFFLQDLVLFTKHQLLLFSIFAPNLTGHGAGAPRAPWLLVNPALNKC